MSKSQVRGQEGTTLSKTHTCAHTVSIYVNKVGSSLAIHGLTNRTQPQVSLCPRLPAMRELWNILILGLVLQLSFLICRSLLYLIASGSDLFVCKAVTSVCVHEANASACFDIAPHNKHAVVFLPLWSEGSCTASPRRRCGDVVQQVS